MKIIASRLICIAILDNGRVFTSLRELRLVKRKVRNIMESGWREWRGVEEEEDGGIVTGDGSPLSPFNLPVVYLKTVIVCPIQTRASFLPIPWYPCSRIFFLAPPSLFKFRRFTSSRIPSKMCKA